MNYLKLYDNIISKRFNNPLKKTKKFCTELHHIIPKCLGGSNESHNLVRLTTREHFIAHRLLSKIHKDDPSLALAVISFTQIKGNKIVSSKEFSKLKEIVARRQSERMEEFFKDSRNRVDQSEKTRKYFEEPANRAKHSKIMIEAMGNHYKNHDNREKRRLAVEQYWGDATNKLKKSTMTKGLWETCEYRTKQSENLERRLQENPWPWQRARAQPSRHIWTLAASFWELSKFNNMNVDKKYNRDSFSKEFCCGKFVNIFSKMSELFAGGWVPKECPVYLEEFGHKM